MLYDQIRDQPLSTKQTQPSDIHIISKANIPTNPETSSIRAFSSNTTLAKLIATSPALNLEWIDLLPGKGINFPSNSMSAILLVSQGNGRLTGGKNDAIQTGDIVVIPAGCEHGCINSSTYQLSLLKIIFDNRNSDAEDTTPPSQRVTLQDVLNYNQQRLEAHVKNSFFNLLNDGTLLDPKKRQIFISCLHQWSTQFQRLMFTRQATCVDQRYQNVFLHHLMEEIGHDKLLGSDQNLLEIKDQILSATASWFVSQMYLLDNVGKTAIVHLVLETSGDEFHNRAKEILGGNVNSKYFDMHAALDDGHAEMGIELLKNQHSIVYARIRTLIEEAWDMFETMMDRIVYLVKQ